MAKLLNLLPWRRRRMQRDLDRELRYHIDRRIAELMQSGLSGIEARRRAAIEFGGVDQVQQDVRDTWSWRWLDHLVHDVRYAGRTLRRNPGFAAAAMLSLALGIGANAAIFSLFDQVLLRALPVEEPERLVLMDWKGNDLAAGRGSDNLMSYPLCRDLQEQERIFDGVFCRHPTMVNLSTEQQPHPVGAEIVSGSYFSVLGVRPELGRLIDESDDLRPGAHPVVVLSYDYWQTNLGGAPDVVGSKVLINNYPMTVIGIAAADFHGVDLGEVPALWIPAMMMRQAILNWDRLLDRRAKWMHVFGRLEPGISAEQAKAKLQPWFKAMLEADTRREGFPQTTDEGLRSFLASTIDVIPAPRGRSDLRSSLREPLSVLMAGTVLLLLLACLNVANLFLARGAARSKEVITRMALGAWRGSVIRQLLIDSALIATGGGVLGLVIAPLVSKALLSFLAQDTARVDLTSGIDHRVFLFAFVVSLLSAGLCGVAPALQIGRVPLISVLKDRSSITTGGIRLRKAVVVVQVAFTLILLIGAGLFVQTLHALHAKGPGFSTVNLLRFGVDPLGNGYSPEESDRIMRNILAQLRSLPEVESVGGAGVDLLTGGSWNQILTIEDDKRFVTDRLVHLNPVSPGFFSTLGVQVIAGRDFAERDMRPEGETGERSIIVNESFARRYFADRNPIGRRIGLGSGPDTETDIGIIGIVTDFSYRNVREQTEQAFLPLAGPGWLYLRVRGEPETAFASVRAAVAEVDPTLPLLELRTLDDQVDRSLTTERMLATLSSGFGAIALLLSVVGLYGLMSFVVTRRTQELGVRLALGATRSAVLWLIAREALIMVGAGTAIALAGAWALGRLIEAQLFGVRPVDGPTIAVASGLLALVALGAAMLPARRAASVSPTEALRFD